MSVALTATLALSMLAIMGIAPVPAKAGAMANEGARDRRLTPRGR